jgi:hypothetical protein
MIYIKLNGGSLRSGKIQGLGKFHDEDLLGNGEVYIGIFDKGKLNDLEGQYIVYTNSGFSSFKGPFIDHKLDGTIEVLIYEDNSSETPQEAEIEGNGPDKNNGRRHILNANNETILSVQKKVIIYSNGVEGVTISTEPVNVKVSVCQRLFGDKCMFSKFEITEV